MKKKTILITGSSRGLGAHAAYRFAEKGHAVVVNYSKSAAEAESLLRKITEETANPNVAAFRADVSSRTDVRTLFDSIGSRFGSCNVLVNMAGINKDGPFLDMDDGQWESVIRTILSGTFICCQEFARRHQEDGGHIVNIGAVTGIRGRKNGVNYCSARAGVINLTRCLALELAPRISVNTVTPGYIATEEVVARHALDIQENRDRAERLVPAARLGTPEDVFRMLDFIVNDSSYITGQNFMVDGGYFMR
jgi:acetoacetyl-CoA reductase/3-oxoacyl-[acyl-carrier protein] reductase